MASEATCKWDLAAKKIDVDELSHSATSWKIRAPDYEE